MPTHKAKCDKCGYGAAFFDPLRSYEMPDGSTVTIQRTFVWCTACREIRWGEELPDLFELERELAAIRGKEPDVVEEFSFFVSKSQTLDELLARQARRLESQIAWRRGRSSGPRCLECGSTDITPLAPPGTHGGSDTWTLPEHPGCGGVVTVLEELTLTLDRGWLRYTPEGEKRQA